MSERSKIEPLAYTIEGAREASGLARSRLFLLIASGELEARKAGRRTLILGNSLRAYLDQLPSVGGGPRPAPRKVAA